jgi:hypothetical protein
MDAHTTLRRTMRTTTVAPTHCMCQSLSFPSSVPPECAQGVWTRWFRAQAWERETYADADCPPYYALSRQNMCCKIPCCLTCFKFNQSLVHLVKKPQPCRCFGTAVCSMTQLQALPSPLMTAIDAPMITSPTMVFLKHPAKYDIAYRYVQTMKEQKATTCLARHGGNHRPG